MTAYAVNPYKGSEDGTGWNFIHQASKNNNVIAITRKNNRENIEKFVNENQSLANQNIKFYYFDLPYWMRFWKKGTIGTLVYFYLWQLFMPIFILKNKLKFDVLHNLNFHNDWIPTFLWVFRKPLIWGPVGHHPPIPSSYIIKAYGYKAYFIDRANYLIKSLVRRLDPFIYIALWRADVILAVNSTTAKKYWWVKHKIKVFPAIGGNQQKGDVSKTPTKFIIFSAGRFEPIKGFDLAIHSFNRFCEKISDTELSNVEFHIAGAGKYQELLKTIANNNRNSSCIKFYNWVSKNEIDTLYKSSSIFFFTSYEGAGMVIPEALSYGLPIVCFNNSGPGESTDDYSSIKADYTSYTDSIELFSNYLLRIFKDNILRENMSKASKLRFDELFDWNKKGELLNSIYNNL